MCEELILTSRTLISSLTGLEMTLLYSLFPSKPSLRLRTVVLLLALSASLSFSMFLTFQLFSSQRTSSERKTPPHRHTVKDSLSQEEFDFHSESKTTCRFHSCFEINNCPLTGRDQIGVFVYPESVFVLEDTREISLFSSVEHRGLLDAVKSSRYYQRNASRACVLVPAVDTLSQDVVNVGDMSLVLHSLPQ